MAGIYIHIPFCKQACHYCNFHFTTSLRRKNELIAALLREIGIQSNYLAQEPVETIYFGGGTPSLLEAGDCQSLISSIKDFHPVTKNCEITIETNPDDISDERLQCWKAAGINRLSIGIQSFLDEDLKWMNRAHTAKQGLESLELALAHFENITADLIYGSPFLSDPQWQKNVEKLISLQVPHISCYALTVEPQTPLYKLIRQQHSPDIDSGKQARQFLLLMDWMEKAGYEHYEISNFSKPGFRSKHNSAYWEGKKYLGLGPSAHSFDGQSRQWNIANNNTYIRSVNLDIIPFEKEILTASQQVNEYIMISLRTSGGLHLNKLEAAIRERLVQESRSYIEQGLLINDQGILKLTKQGKLMADGIASAFFEG
ncbi:MAG: radical SAM family heme chaperone HemW [Terrimonas sp.]|nr:radical SAM family heme chaperone HemW [Terrimonas sp.]